MKSYDDEDYEYSIEEEIDDLFFFSFYESDKECINTYTDIIRLTIKRIYEKHC